MHVFKLIQGAIGWAPMIAASLLLGAPVPAASADQCPDVEVVFARGSGEPPGLGSVGGPFVDALRSQIGSKTLGVYPVNYPASTDFSSGTAFAVTVIDGIRDAGSHIESMASNCPNTREVLGGYSQGAALAGYVTSAAVPPGVPAAAVPAPMPPEVANHVAAVTLFGTPSAQFLQQYGAPVISDRPAVSAEDPGVVRSGRRHLRVRWHPRPCARPLRGERHDRPGRELCRQSPLIASRP